MRELKFRVWDTTGSKWMNVFEIDLLDQCYINNSDEYPIQQFTGLVDTNGKDVYEGDLVKWNSKISIGGFDQLFVVKWFDEQPVFGNCVGGFRLFGTKHNKDNPHIMCCGLDTLDIQVVGNIFENPELLKY